MAEFQVVTKKIMMKFSKYFIFLNIFLMVFLLSGCYQPRQIKNMVVAPSDIPCEILMKNNQWSKFKRNILVSSDIIGIGVTSVGQFQWDISNFNVALRQSLKNFDLYSPNMEARYKISMNSCKAYFPLAGFDMHVKCQVNYQVMDTFLNKIIYKKTISSSHISKAFDAYLGSTRVRFAEEGASKENIKKLIIELSEL